MPKNKILEQKGEIIYPITKWENIIDKPANISSDNIFIADYGITTYQEVIEAINAGKVVYVRPVTEEDEEINQLPLIPYSSQASYGNISSLIFAKTLSIASHPYGHSNTVVEIHCLSNNEWELTFQEFFVNSNINNGMFKTINGQSIIGTGDIVIAGGGGSGPAIITLDNTVFFGESNIELTTSSSLNTLLSSSNQSPINDASCDSKYYYIAMPSTYSLKVITENNENITDLFNSKSMYAYNNVPYILYEFHLSSDVPLNANINITISE